LNRDIRNSVNIEILNTQEGDPSVSDDDYIVNVDEDNNIKLISNVAPTFIRKKRILDDASGTQQIYSSYDNYFNLVQRTTEQEGYNKTRTYWNKDRTIYSESKNSTTNSFSDDVSVSIRGINPNLIDMNSALSLKGNINNNYIDGTYLITSVTTMYNTDNYDTYNNSIVLTATKKITLNGLL
jgi:hypothetical protein